MSKPAKIAWVFFVLLLAGCGLPGEKTAGLVGYFPKAGVIPGWEISQPLQSYNPENLFNLVDGQADSFFAYGFQQVAVQRYRDDQGAELNAEIWQLATPADAYGLFSVGRAGTPAAFGNEADSDPGRRLAFWQAQYFVSLSGLQPLPDETLQAFAKTISAALPTGGEPPTILGRLPETGLVEPNRVFFHEEMSIQMKVWLGGENLLGLSQATDGALGRYQLDGVTARLVLVQYPKADQAAAGLKALQGGGLTDLAASAVNGNLLGAVFGKLDPGQAQALLQAALK